MSYALRADFSTAAQERQKREYLARLSKSVALAKTIAEAAREGNKKMLQGYTPEINPLTSNSGQAKILNLREKAFSILKAMLPSPTDYEANQWINDTNQLNDFLTYGNKFQSEYKELPGADLNTFKTIWSNFINKTKELGAIIKAPKAPTGAPLPLPRPEPLTKELISKRFLRDEKEEIRPEIQSEIQQKIRPIEYRPVEYKNRGVEIYESKQKLPIRDTSKDKYLAERLQHLTRPLEEYSRSVLFPYAKAYRNDLDQDELKRMNILELATLIKPLLSAQPAEEKQLHEPIEEEKYTNQRASVLERIRNLSREKPLQSYSRDVLLPLAQSLNHKDIHLLDSFQLAEILNEAIGIPSIHDTQVMLQKLSSENKLHTINPYNLKKYLEKIRPDMIAELSYMSPPQLQYLAKIEADKLSTLSKINEPQTRASLKKIKINEQPVPSKIDKLANEITNDALEKLINNGVIGHDERSYKYLLNYATNYLKKGLKPEDVIAKLLKTYGVTLPQQILEMKESPKTPSPKTLSPTHQPSSLSVHQEEKMATKIYDSIKNKLNGTAPEKDIIKDIIQDIVKNPSYTVNDWIQIYLEKINTLPKPTVSPMQSIQSIEIPPYHLTIKKYLKDVLDRDKVLKDVEKNDDNTYQESNISYSTYDIEHLNSNNYKRIYLINKFRDLHPDTPLSQEDLKYFYEYKK